MGKVIQFPTDRVRKVSDDGFPAYVADIIKAVSVGTTVPDSLEEEIVQIIGKPQKREPLPSVSRDEAIEQIRAALKKRTGRSWSVTGGKGTSWGWIKVGDLPRNLVNGCMTEKTKAILKKALSLETIHGDYESIPASTDYYWEYIDRANGRTPRVIGKPYWD